MSVTINIPEDLYQEAKAMADAHHMSVDDVIASAFAEQLAAWERLKQRAARGRREEYLKELEKFPTLSLKITIVFDSLFIPSETSRFILFNRACRTKPG